QTPEQSSFLVGSSEQGRLLGDQQKHGSQEEGAQHGHRNKEHSPRWRSFEEQEAMMRAASAARWAEDELLCLKNAFSLQLERLEADWAAHEEKIGAEYDARRGLLQARAGLQTVSKGLERLGTPSAERGRAGSAAGDEDIVPPPSSSGRWRSSEKQSRLIHTAPVFQPDAGKESSSVVAGGRNSMRGTQVLGNSGGGSGGRRNSGTRFGTRESKKELERLDEAFSLLADQVRSQKEAAQKWIRRQNIRMEAQIEGMEEERDRRQRWLLAAEKEEKQLITAVLEATQ
ncbi:unnamed protein product, partial [Hapterophycus canaliculatus]